MAGVERTLRRNDLPALDLEAARSYVRLIGKQLSALDPMLKVYRETKNAVRISAFVDDYHRYVEKRLEGAGLILEITKARDFTVLFPRGRLMQIVDNLVRNSEYWLQVPKAKKQIKKPTIEIEIDKPTLTISDNGFGVRTEIEDQIFDMFVSDKPTEAGRGLGLFICREILSRYGCEISLADDRNKWGRRYRFEVNLRAITQ